MGRFFLRIFDGIAKILAFLLISLGLWLPAVYSVAYFVICGMSDITLKGSAVVIYWCGLALSAVMGFMLSVYIRGRFKRKNTVVAQAPQEKKKKKNRVTEEPVQNFANMNSQGYIPPNQYPPQPPFGQPNMYSQPPYAQNYYAPPPPYAQGYMPPQQPYAPPPETAKPSTRDTGDLERKYFDRPQRYERTASFDEDSLTQSYGKTMTKTEQRAADSKFDSDELWRRLSGADVPTEQPLVFRTRKDPDLYVYEYSDRYQYWRRTNTGMVFENTEYKKK